MTGQRWYDQPGQESIRTSLKFLTSLPDEFLTIVAEGILKVAENEFKPAELKALGVEKVMAIHKSKNKARPEDNNPYLHKSVNYLAIMSSFQQRFRG